MHSPHPFGFLTLSTIVHTSLAAGLLMLSDLTPFPEGGGGTTTVVEFESIDAQGSPKKTVELAKVDIPKLEEKSKPVPVAPPPKKETPLPKVVQKKSEPKTVVKELPKKTEVVKPVEPKVEKVETKVQEESPVAVIPEIEEIKEQPLETESSAEEDRALEEEIVAAEKIEEAVETEQIEDVAQEPSQNQVDVPTPSAAPAAASAEQPMVRSGNKGENPNASAPAGPPGPAQGMRTYEELRQMAGNRPPQYPFKARFQKQQGQVVLQYFVTGGGQVENLRMLQSSGFPMLDDEAVRAIAKYRYVPGQAGWTLHPVNFSLVGPAEGTGGRLRTSMK